LSFDHKPDNIEEKKRIEDAGGMVEDNRVDAILNLSRSFGDFEYKNSTDLSKEQQKVSIVPEITVTHLSANSKFLILACDGIWDCMTNEVCCDFILGELNGTSEKEITKVDAKESEYSEEFD
jgi:protein phosphatase 2C family protein 2/3